MGKEVLIVFVATLTVVLLAFVGIGIKMLLRRRGEFKRACASRDPYTGDGGGCACAAKKVCEERENRAYQPLEVNETLLEEIGQ